ncbi:NAD(P)H-binding protein, partial [Thermodesulfobacteriota bacterium]
MSEQQSKPIVLITGATGYIGRRLTHHLLAGNRYSLRLFVRNRRKVQAATAESVEVFEGTTFEPDTLAEALKDVDTAFYLIHSMGSDEDYRKLDLESAENFRRAAIAAGVRRIVYLGGLGNRSSASKHLLSRIETGETLSAEPDKISTIWFRAGVIVGSGSASFEIVRNLCHKLPFMLTPRWVRSRTEAIGIDDVISYLEQSVELQTEENLVVDIGSGEITFQDMITQAAGVMGLRRYLVAVPVLSPRISSYWLILFTSVPYRVAASLVEGLKSETVKENDHARMFFPEIEPLSYTESVAQAMHELEQNQILSRWCDSSSEKACDIKDFDDPAGAVLRDTRIVPYENQESQNAVYRSVCA